MSFDYFEIVRIRPTPSDRASDIAGLEGAVLGISEDEGRIVTTPSPSMTATQVLEASIRRISNLRDGMIVASRSTTDRLFESPSAANYSTRTRSRSASALGWASVLSSEEEWTQVTGPKPAPAVVAAAFFDHVR